MNQFTKKQTGDAGENYCVTFLKKKHYRILSRNYRKPYGEIDIVAEKDGVVCFVEVKTRHTNPFTQPYEAVDFRKQQRLIRAAQAYIAEYAVQGFCRFDVCEVFTDKDTLRLKDIHYIENAFEAG